MKSNTSKHKIILIVIIYSSLIFSTGYFITLVSNSQLAFAQSASPKSSTKPKPSPTAKPVVAQIETVATSSADLLGINNGSWAGEIISNSDVAIYPLQEGAIIQWNVGIGQNVTAGQILGKLSAPPVNLERNATLAERQQELANARSKLAATSTYVQNSKRKLQEQIKAATDSRDNEYKIIQREGDEQIRKQTKAQTDAEWTEKITGADIESAALDRELLEAQGEVRSSEAAYNTVSRGIDINIYALKAGIISGVFKNIGDYVTPETLIASIGNETSNQDDKIVRFSIPSNYSAPAKGTMVKITRPGYPFTNAAAEITGVGTALDSNGSYVAEAKFKENIDWPVHASVRVIKDGESGNQVFVPIASLWWDDQGSSKVWVIGKDKKASARLVKSGRTVGDRVEINEGLAPATKYIARNIPEIKEGSTIQEFKEGGTTTPKSGGDGHDHEH